MEASRHNADKSQLLLQLKNVEHRATASKWYRLLDNPLRYTKTIIHRNLIYPLNKKEKKAVAQTFFGYPLHIKLPSGTDIYLTGGKSHNAEIRLAKFLILQLQPGHSFLDIGAHYGYFTLLASKLVGSSGTVIAIEASANNYAILKKNSLRHNNIKHYHIAAGAKETIIDFYEFPNQFSEYNAVNPTQYQNAPWYKKNTPTISKIKALPIENLLAKKNCTPQIIKLDIEGAEANAIKGLQNHLSKHNPTMIVEHSLENKNTHALQLLHSLGYQTYSIKDNGKITPLDNPEQHLTKHQMDTDNLVLIKSPKNIKY